jgi:predicted lipoprotein with Yx(FWY)xxD motif
MYKRLVIALFVVFALVMPAASAQDATTVMTAEDPEYGTYFTDAEGMALYIFLKDVPNSGGSTCYDQCEENWPVFSAEEPLTLPEGVPGELGTITRTDDSTQVTYNGWPLYYWVNDKAPGDVTGQNVGEVWFLAVPTDGDAIPGADVPEASPMASPAAMGDTTILTAEDPEYGTYFTDAEGMALYIFLSDALLTTSAPSDTTSAILIAETDDGIRAVSRLDRVEGSTWSGEIALHPNLQEYVVLLYSSPYAAAPDAAIRITVQQCTGTSLATFDPSSCEPVTPSSSILQEVLPADEAERGRPVDISTEDGGITMANLEEREYIFRPTDPNTDILVIPTGEPQTTDNNVLEVDAASPQGTFTVEIDANSGTSMNEAAYTVYLFDRAPTIAMVHAPYAAAMATGVRP